MAKNRWKRDPTTGLTKTEMSRVPEESLTDDGRVDMRAYLDCNIVKPQDFADAAGYKDARYFIDMVLTDPSSPFHAHQLKDVNGKTLRYLTHIDSARAGGERIRRETLARQTGYDADAAKGKLLPPLRLGAKRKK